MIALHPERAARVELPAARQQIPPFRVTETRVPIPTGISAAALRAMNGLAILDVSPSGVIEFATDRAFALLAKYFPSPLQLFPQKLPELLIQWLKHAEPLCSTTGLSGDGPDQLRVHITGREDGNFQLLLDERSDAVMVQRLATLGLTRKEAEVLLWISRGKTDGDIATILGSRPRTVNKHTEQIRAKLGVETRTAAAAVAMELISLSH